MKDKSTNDILKAIGYLLTVVIIGALIYWAFVLFSLFGKMLLMFATIGGTFMLIRRIVINSGKHSGKKEDLRLKDSRPIEKKSKNNGLDSFDKRAMVVIIIIVIFVTVFILASLPQ